MGVIRWLNRVDPATWDRAVRRIEDDNVGLLERSAAAAFLRDFNKEPTESLLEQLAEIGDEDEFGHSALLNTLLETATTDASWYLDKSLDRFGELASVLPCGSALSRIIDFDAIDVDLPPSCRATESGLYGCCSPVSLAGLAELFRRFGSPESVAAVFTQRDAGRVVGAGSVAEMMRQAYYAEHWRNLGAAVLESSGMGHYVGLGMSV